MKKKYCGVSEGARGLSAENASQSESVILFETARDRWFSC